MVGIEGEGFLAPLLFAEAIEALHGGMAVGAVLPLAGCPPLELGGYRCVGQCLAGGDKRLHVDAVID